MRVVVSAAVTLLAFAFTAVPAEAMQLFVLTLEGNHFTFEVEPTDLVEDVKTQVSRKTGIPADQIALVFAGRELLDGNTLDDYSIKKDSTLHLVRRYLSASVDGEPATEVHIGQTVTLQAVWEMSRWGITPAQASFYLGDPAEGRLLGTVAIQSQGNQRVATLGLAIADGVWALGSNTVTVSLENPLGLSTYATLSVADSAEPGPEPVPDLGAGGDIETDPDAGEGADTDTGATGDSTPSSGARPSADPSDSTGSAEPTARERRVQRGALPATGDYTLPIVIVYCCAGALLLVGGALRRR